MSVHSAITNTHDGWTNVYRGIGSQKDITTSTNFQRNSYKSLLQYELNSLYSTNWIAAKVVNMPVDDALKDEREITIENANDKEIFLQALEGFKIDYKISRLMRWSKVFGSAVIIIVSNDGKMSDEFKIENVRKGGISNFVVLDRFDIYSTVLDRNPLSPRYLEPEYYQLTKSGELIHHSRVLKLDGEETTNFDKELLQGFGLSVYERLYKTIMNAQMSPDLLINLLAQSNIDVFKILGLNDALTDGQDELVLKRLTSIMEGKSIFNGVALDKEDDYVNISKTFAGLSDINKEFYQVIAGAADIPFSRFMGATLNGLNPTGNGEMKNYYDKVIAEQKEVRHIYTTIDKILQMHLFGKLIDGYKWEYPSLFQMTDEEISIIENRNATTKEIYLRNGVVNEIEAKASLVDNPLFPTITAESYEKDKQDYEEMESISIFSEEESTEEENEA